MKTFVTSGQSWKKTPTGNFLANFFVQDLTGNREHKLNPFFTFICPLCFFQSIKIHFYFHLRTSTTVLEKMSLDLNLSCLHSTLIIHVLVQYSLHSPIRMQPITEQFLTLNKYIILENINLCLLQLLRRKWLNFSRREVMYFKTVLIQCTTSIV